MIRNDRTGCRGGGVAIYLRCQIPYKVISQSPSVSTGSAEHLFIEVTLSHVKVLLGVVYSPDRNVDYFSGFDSLIQDFVPLYQHTIIQGDFNTCLLKNDSRSRRLLSIVEGANLQILPSNSTHHVPNCVPSLLDISIVSSLDHVATHGQFAADAFSYHDLIYLSYKIRPPKTKAKVVLQRNFKDMDHDLLRQDAGDTNWNQVYDADSVDAKVNSFNSILTSLYDKHAPVRAIRLKHLPAPWLTPELRELMSQKTAAKTAYKMNSSELNRDKYVRARNRSNTACRDAQRRHIHASIANGDPPQVWKFLNTLGIGKSKPDSPSDVDVQALNAHLTSGAASFDSVTKSRTLQLLENSLSPSPTSLDFAPVPECVIRKHILSISSNAVGCDDVSRKMIIPVLDIVLPVITHILNFSLSSSTVPSVWKQALVIPIPKISCPSSLSHYRPISILPFLSKVLERVVHHQLYNYLSSNHLLNALQSGFRPGHSTVTSLIKVSDDIRLGMEQRKVTLLTLLDFSNAFNSVDFDVLISNLKLLNLSSSVTNWFRSYLEGRRQRVKVDGKLSDWCSISAGVPQGGVLSPLLFSIFINSISQNLTCSYHLYADDLQIYAQEGVNNIERAICEVNANLDVIASWATAFGLTVNPSKSQTIIIGGRGQLARVDRSQLSPISFMGTIIPYSETVKNLGIYFDTTLSWSRQVNEVSRKIFASLRSLGRLRNFLPIKTKITLAQSLLLPILDYADVCYLDLTEELLNKLERLQNAAIRFAFGLRKFDHISEYRAQLKWLPIRLRRNSHILSLLFNILHNPTIPDYLKERFGLRAEVHQRQPRSINRLLLACPVHRTEFYSKSFTVQSVRLWNCLPPSIRAAESLQSFKKLLRAHFESQCGYAV